MGSQPIKRKKNLLEMMIMAQSIPRVSIPPGHLSGICHLVDPGSGEFVRKPLLGGGHLSVLLEAIDIAPFSISSIKNMPI